MSEKSEIITGILERIRFKKEENGFHILDVEVGDTSYVITGNYPLMHEGLTYEFEGTWVVHPKFGKQMNATKILEATPNSKDGLKAYLSSNFFNGIGPIIASRIVAKFGDDVIRIFNEDIDRLLEVKGVSPAKLEIIKKSWEKNGEINEIMIFLQQYGISAVYAAKIYKHYGNECVSKIKLRPYEIAGDIKGIGFKYADKIAMEVGIDPESEERIMACIHFILDLGTSDGHCYLFRDQILIKSTDLLSVDIRNRIDDILNNMVQEDSIKTVYLEKDEPTRYYSKKVYLNEKKVANIIGELLRRDVKQVVSKDMLPEQDGDFMYSDEQVEAIFEIINKGVSILTGGPGTGKTSVTKGVFEVLNNLGRKISLCAPTGRAAQRMQEVIGAEASTIHRLLDFDPENFGFLHNEENPLHCDFLFVDESSMIDVNLMCSLLSAVGSSCQVLLIGDFDQLPPIGPGSPFKDMVECGVVPTAKLTKIFRQGAESKIVSYAHKINNGEHPIISSPLTEPKLWESGEDCMFIDSGLRESGKPFLEYPNWSSLRYGLNIVDMITHLYVETINKYYDFKDIQILIPMKISDLGTIKINETIQKAANPESPSKNEIKFKERIFREGDKIIHTVNNYDLDVMNGDIGFIDAINESDQTAEIKFSNDRIVKYKKSDLFEIDLGYCITIHKAQGSEFECVIMPIMNQYSRMLYRNLLYTGLTRAKKLAIFVGQRFSLENSIDNIDARIRQTSLKELLIEADMINSYVI